MATHTVGGVVYAYTYDDVGNILTISENGTLRYSYNYDKLGQLISAEIYESNALVEVYEYSYDKSGNITVLAHHYGTGLSNSDVKTYTYGNETWGDLLTNYNGTNITYDAIGNPLNWRNASNIEWQGRRLELLESTSGKVFDYTYNSDGIRTQKRIYNAGGVLESTVNYILDGSKIIAEHSGNTYTHYIYDESGSVMGMMYNNQLYTFRKNLQGDVTGIYNASGDLVVEYTYSPYGEVLSTTGSMANTLGTSNPFRYRGYYYDTETGFYYLNSRYYDPAVGRFLNADDVSAFAVEQGSLLQYNPFVYCLNDPISRVDENGMWSMPKWAKKAVAAVAVVAVVAVVAAVTVATAGAGTAVAAVAVGAAKGAAIGLAVGAATGAAGGAISHRITTGSWEGAGEAALNGMADGALSGAVSGVITGGITGGLSYNSGATSAGKGFDTYRQLKNAIGSPGAGNEWHHIVEQSQIAKSGFSPQMIQNTNNIISISKTTHRAISGYYSSVQPFTNGMIVRNWLAGQSFSARYEFGINVIKMFM